MKAIHPIHDASHTSEQACFHIPTCVECKKAIHFDAGDTINGSKWYHSSCWSLVEKKHMIICQS
ncbi:MAG TPA: hypothetical protein VFP45_03985 [Candidatus Nitrosotalea sp.]|nr:hypothetical protein [Candidatus Nitrosotalea sp.]